MEQGNTKRILAILAILALVVVGALLLKDGQESVEVDENADDTSLQVREGEREVMGEIVCLPYKTQRANTECVKGIWGTDGVMYALNSVGVRGSESAMNVGTKVRAVGTYQKADQGSEESQIFTYDGVLVLRTLTKEQ